MRQGLVRKPLHELRHLRGEGHGVDGRLVRRALNNNNHNDNTNHNHNNNHKSTTHNHTHTNDNTTTVNVNNTNNNHNTNNNSSNNDNSNSNNNDIMTDHSRVLDEAGGAVLAPEVHEHAEALAEEVLHHLSACLEHALTVMYTSYTHNYYMYREIPPSSRGPGRGGSAPPRDRTVLICRWLCSNRIVKCMFYLLPIICYILVINMNSSLCYARHPLAEAALHHLSGIVR